MEKNIANTNIFILRYNNGKQVISVVVNCLILLGFIMEWISYHNFYTPAHLALQYINGILLVSTLVLFLINKKKYYSTNYLIISYSLIITIILSSISFQQFFDKIAFSRHDFFARNIFFALCIIAFIGFITSKKHIIIQGILLLLYISYDLLHFKYPFVVESAPLYYLATIGFCWVMYFTVDSLNKFTQELSESNNRINDLQEINSQKKKKLEQYNKAMIDLSKKITVSINGKNDSLDVFSIIINVVALNLKCSRVSVWLLSEDKKSILRKCLIDEGIYDNNLQELKESDFPNYFYNLLTQAYISAPNAITHKGTTEFKEVYLKPLNIVSMLDCPIKLNNEVIGVICCEHKHDMKSWEYEDILFTQSVSDYIAIHLMNIESQSLLLSISQKNKEIFDSINYAKRLQLAMMPTENQVKQFFKNSFVLYKPKDIVSGDFYWMEVTENNIFFALADCTGHGVPGAMVSFVCYNALNQAVRDYKCTDPGEILNKTRELVIQHFEKSEETVADGMDISLFALDLKANSLTWAGANNPLILVSENKLSKLNPHKQPIGVFSNPVNFTSTSVDLKKGDIIYLYTDGYVDQFGGEHHKKMTYRRLKELIQVFYDKDMDSQKQLFAQAFIDWSNNTEQVDDMCIIGIKFDNANYFV